MSLSYIGNCEWEPSGEPEPHNPPNELPTTSESWIGRSDKMAAFLATYRVGVVRLGGFIIDVRVRDGSPFLGVGSADLVIARPPDFGAALEENSTSTQTFQKSATVTALDVIPEATEVRVRRKTTARVTTTLWRYFSGSLPGGPRFSSVANGANPRILADSVTAVASKPDGASRGEVYIGSWAGSPPSVRDALRLGITSYAEAHSAERIAGTPWYRCTDVCVKGFDTGEDADS